MKIDLAANVPGGPDNLLVRTRGGLSPVRRRSPQSDRRKKLFERKSPATSCGPAMAGPPGQRGETSAKVGWPGFGKPEACDNHSRWLSERSARYHRNRSSNLYPEGVSPSVLPLAGVDRKSGSLSGGIVPPSSDSTTGYDCGIPPECLRRGIKRLLQRSQVVPATISIQSLNRSLRS